MRFIKKLLGIKQKEPTVYQKFLAVHMHFASNASALSPNR